MTSSFVLMRDQIRDWRFALGPLSDLPLTGTQSTAGGSSLGPIYYWWLWASRVLIGPFTDNLPTAGAIGIVLLHTGADLALLEALRRVFGSFWLALATVLLVATTSHELAISATIWNPAVSVAFVKIALAVALITATRRSVGWTVAAAVAAWFAVQAHSVAIFVAAPLLAAALLRDAAARDVRGVLQKTRAIVETIFVLQLPFLYHAWTSAGAEAGPTRAVGGLTDAVRHPETLRLGESFRALVTFIGHIFTAPWSLPVWAALFAMIALAAAWRARRDLGLLSTSLLPLVCAAIGLSLWRGNFDEYWYLPLAPCAAIAVAAAVSLVRTEWAAIALLTIVIAVQPWRLAHAQTIYRMPEYAALARGAKAIIRQTPTIRRIETTFTLPPLSDATFLYEVLGGHVTTDAPFIAVIDEKGGVRFVPVGR